MPKQKQCKRKECRIKADAENGVMVNMSFFCSYSCASKHGIELSNKMRERSLAKQKREKIESNKADKKAVRELNRKCKRWQDKHTQAAFNKMRRAEELLWFKERGLNPICISCGLELGGDEWCCGHLKTRKAWPELRYDRKNTFLQHNVRCNKNLSGDIEGYKAGLVKRFGKKEGLAIIEYCESYKEPLSRSCGELEAMRKVFNATLRRIVNLSSLSAPIK